MGDDDVDKDIAEAFRDLRDAQKEGFAKLGGQLEGVRKDAQDHYRDDAALFATLNASVSTAHKRLDGHLEDHREERSGKIRLWIGIIVAFLSAVFAAIVAFFGGKKP